MSKFIRTCLNCGANCYSPEDYKTHMQGHGKMVSKSEISSPRKVDQGMVQKATFDVPEEILVKPKDVEEKKDKPAKSRERRAPAKAEEKVEAPAEVTEAPVVEPTVEPPIPAVAEAPVEAEAAPAKPKTTRKRSTRGRRKSTSKKTTRKTTSKKTTSEE
jgi:hypothetical protein